MLHWSISWRATGGVERENSGDSPEKDSGQGDRRLEVEGRTRIQLRKQLGAGRRPGTWRIVGSE
jgi:hypothetical protein